MGLDGECKSYPSGCYDCGLPYASHKWADVVVPDSVWEKINPTSPHREGGGLLCFNCIVGRLAEAGEENVAYLITSGPLSFNPRR